VCGHENFGVLLNCEILRFLLSIISRASEVLVCTSSDQFKLRLTSIMTQRPIRVAVCQTAVIVTIIPAARPIALMSCILVLLVGYLHPKIVRISRCRRSLVRLCALQ
jgi:hypothetical protein